MNSILKFIVNMIPYMLITVPIYLIARIVFLKSKKATINWCREGALFFFVVFIAGLASQTVIPKFEFGVNGLGIVHNGGHHTNLIPFKVFFDTYREVFVNQQIHYFLINFLGNIVMFIPFGLMIPLLWKVSGKRTVLIGFCSSLFIECSQLFLARESDVDDLLLNTAGVLLGLLIYKRLQKTCSIFIKKFHL